MRRPHRPVTGPRPKRERDPQRRRNRGRGMPKNKSASTSTASATISTVVMRVCYPTRGGGKRPGVSSRGDWYRRCVPSDVDPVVKAVDGQYQEWLATLGELVRIPSVSGDPPPAGDAARR